MREVGLVCARSSCKARGRSGRGIWGGALGRVEPGRRLRELFASIGCTWSSREGPRAETGCSGLLEAQGAEVESE